MTEVSDAPVGGILSPRSKTEAILFKFRNLAEKITNPHRGRKAEVQISFDTTKMDEEQKKALVRAQMELTRAGISFDSGGGLGGRHWEFDWSLKGPAKVKFVRWKK